LARKILLADDSVTAQNMGRKILADAGYEVITVNNGSAALKKIGEQRPDVIVLDVYMPGYSGLEVCQRLKEVGDTAGIPILLTVGKLEPFKPEEAKRVRADAFIVKPFEASELLSALTKLEDKIVPRQEASKPGRFGRLAAAENSRFDKTMAVEEDAGWKNRIAFPAKKKEKEKEVEADEPAAYSAPVKDMRAAIEEMPVERMPAQSSEEKFDLGALATAGLPKDVTPEEIAALAAAAARVKGKIPEKQEQAEMAVVAQPEFSQKEEPAPVAADALLADAALEDVKEEPSSSEPKGVCESYEALPAITNPEGSVEAERATAAIQPSSQETSENAGEPVTMAVAAAVGQSSSQASRWTAVSVAVAPDEAGISLEQEMQKAYAAFAAAESGHSSSITSDSGNLPAEASVSVPASAAPEAVQTLSAVASAATEAVTAAVRELENVASAYAQAGVEASSAGPSELHAAEAAEKDESPVAPVLAGPEAQADRTHHAVEEVKPEFETTAPAVENASAATEVSQQPATEGSAAEPAPSLAEQSEAHHSPSSPESSLPADAAAMAAAVGGRVIEESAGSDSDPAIASIVDSVLANLRPKIVEEISRKLGKK